MSNLEFRTNEARLQCCKRPGCAWVICGGLNHQLTSIAHFALTMPLCVPLARPIPAAIVAGCLSINITVTLWAVIARPALNSDFRGPWSFANFARSQNLAEIYQAAPMQAFQHQLYPGFQSFFPFQYPPSFLLPIWWLGGFSYPVAFSLWTLAGMAALVAAGWIFFPARTRWFAIAALLAAPASLLNGVSGETGFYTAAILLAGFGLLPSRPFLAGLAFGLMTLKPQLGVLIPFALLARRDYRAMFSACLTALALIGLSCLVFPAALWVAWAHQVPIFEAQYLAADKSLGLDAGVTIAADLARIGIAPGIARVMQTAASLIGAGAMFLLFKRARYRFAVAALLAGTCLCTPHGYAYDTISLIAGMLLLPDSIIFPSLCLLTYLAPYLLLTGADTWFYYAIPETLLFLGIIYLALHRADHPNIRHEPVPSAKPKPVEH